MKHTSLILFALVGSFLVACQPDLQRECTSASDCPTGYRCMYSSCEPLDAGESPNNAEQPDADADADSAQEEDLAQDPAPDAHEDPDADAGEDVGADTDAGEDANNDDAQDVDADVGEDLSADADADGAEDADVGPECDEGEMECGQGCVDVLGDADHCGSCEACPSVEGAMAACERGSCVYECSQGRVDANGDLALVGSDGCECEPSGVEVCDNVDNDCNGVPDDMPTLTQICPDIPFSLPVCAEGGCSYACLPQRVDVNGDLGEPGSDGCECLVTGLEICDNQDNDCDGEVDEDNDSLCAMQAGSSYACQDGVCFYECIEGRVDANQDLQSELGDGCECVPSGEEICDNIDNDCNGQVDEENINLCTPKDNTIHFCDHGQCKYSCEETYYDANQNLSQDLGDGCECRFQGAEVCDLMDNDCDGLVDEEENSILCEIIYRASSSCEEGSCVYACEEDYYVDLNRDLLSMPSDGCECDSRTPEQCDGVDNDCDGSTDAQDPNYVPSACEYATGACAGASRRCEQGAPVPCTLEDYRAYNPLVTGLPNSHELLCDGEDNNCNGVEDELCCSYQEAQRLVSAPLHPTNQQLAPSLAMDPEERYSMFVWQEHPSIGVVEPPKQGSVRLAMIDNRTGATAYAIHYPSEDPIQNYHPTVTWDGEAFVNVWVRRINASQSYLSWQKKELDNNDYLTNIVNARSDVDLSQPHVVGLGDGSTFLSWSQGTLSPNPNACPNTQATRCIQYAVLDENGNTLEVHEVATGSGRKAIFPRYTPDGAGGGLLTWIEPSVSRSRLAWMYLDDSRTPGTVSYREIENNNQDIRPSVVRSQDKYYIIYASYSGNWGLSMVEISSTGTANPNSTFLTSSQYILRDYFATYQNQQIHLYWVSTGFSSLILSRASFDPQGQTQRPASVLSNLYNASFGAVFALPSPSYGEVFVAATNSASNQPLGSVFSYINLRGDALCP